MVRKLALILVVITFVAILGSLAVQFAYQESQPETNIVGESVNVTQFDTPLTLEDSNIEDATYDEEVIVRDPNDNITDTPEDYIWYEENGTVEFNSTGEFELDEEAEVGYGYRSPDEIQALMYTVWVALFEFWPLYLVIIAVYIVLQATEGL